MQLNIPRHIDVSSFFDHVSQILGLSCVLFSKPPIEENYVNESVIQFSENKILLYKIKPIFPKLYEVPRNDEQIQCLLPYERLDRSNSQPIFEMINSDDPALLWKQELPTSSWKCSARSLTCYSYQSQIISLILVSASGVHIMAAGNNEWSMVALWKCCGNWLTHTMYHIKQASLKTFFPLFV